MTSFVDRLRTWLRRESAEAQSTLDELSERLSRDLDRRERTLDASPVEKLRMAQDEIAEDDSLDAVRDRIESLGDRSTDPEG